jgi:hypothetical protein
VVKTWFQTLLSNARYTATSRLRTPPGRSCWVISSRWEAVQVASQLPLSFKAPGFNPCCGYEATKTWFQKFAVKFNLYRYVKVVDSDDLTSPECSVHGGALHVESS